MEEITVKVNELEEIERDDELEEVSESSGGGSFVAGMIGGFLAYAAISGAKKLWTFGAAKLAERKRKKPARKPVVDAEFIEVEDEQTDSEEEASKE